MTTAVRTTSRARAWLPLAGGGAAVPVGRHLLFAERRRAALTIGGVSAALLLVLAISGIFAGAIEQVTHYIRTSPAGLFVSQSGVRTMHMSSSTLPPDAVAEVDAVPGVAWAAPIAFTSGSIGSPDGRQLTYVIGYDTGTGRGGPTELVAGRPPAIGEAVLDDQAAQQLGVKLGDTATVLGVPVRVVGLSTGGSSITNTTVFVSRGEFARLRDHRVSYVLVGVSPGSSTQTVADRISANVPGVTVQTRDQFADSEARIVTDMSADLLQLMTFIALLIALAVIALGLMTATLNRIRDFAVLKVLGAPTRSLVRAVVVQVWWTVLLASLLAATLAEVLSRALLLAAPTVLIVLPPLTLLRTAGEALVVGLVAAVWPLRRIVAVDAATAFRDTR